jgi:hypothetical protein
MASLTPTPKQQLYGSDGAPLVGGKIYTYAAGTTTPLATYTNYGGGTANTNPIILNSLGQADIWLGTSSYKFSVYTSADVLLYTVDNISAPIDSSALATALSSPTPIGNTAPNTGAFTTLTATTGTITTTNATTVNATTVNATTSTTSGVTTTGTLTFSGGGSMTRPPEAGIQSLTATIATNALTVTLNPTTLDFRSSTLASGTVVTRTIGSAISVTVSSGSTLGTVSAVQSRIVVLALDNAGTVELAVVNIAGGTNLTETGLISTTAEGGAGAADSASTVYSTTARSNVAYRVVGYIESTQTTAGTWATTPSTIQGYGGQALASMSSLGYGQTWQDFTSTRVSGTTYYNTTGKPIMVAVNTSSGASNGQSLTLTVSGINISNSYFALSSQQFAQNCIGLVPPSASYSVAVSSTSIGNWNELR